MTYSTDQQVGAGCRLAAQLACGLGALMLLRGPLSQRGGYVPRARDPREKGGSIFTT